MDRGYGTAIRSRDAGDRPYRRSYSGSWFASFRTSLRQFVVEVTPDQPETSN